MATTTLTWDFQRITVSGTTEHTITFDTILIDDYGHALIDWVSGTAIQLSGNGVAIDTATGTLSTNQPKLILQLKKGVPIRYKGGAGSEIFQITILSE